MGVAVFKSVVRKSVISVTLIALVPTAAWADKTDDIVNAGVTRTKAGASSQKRIDAISDATEKVITKTNQQAKVVEGLKVYNKRLQRTLDAQELAKGKLEQSIENASLIERQIVPLMLRMIGGLEKFIEIDAPFKLDERNARVQRIKGYLNNANITAAERFRQVLEAYTIESSYGQSIDVYTDTLALSSGEVTVNILQVGRSGLYYQTLDGNQSGYWDKANKAWTALDGSHNEGITNAIRITQGKETKGLMRLPIAAPEAI